MNPRSKQPLRLRPESAGGGSAEGEERWLCSQPVGQEGCEAKWGAMPHPFGNGERRQRGDVGWAGLEFGWNPRVCRLHADEEHSCGWW